MSITRSQIARQLLAEGGMPMKEIKGQNHMLAYITPNEADKLVRLGGQETMTPEGIPAYPEYDNYGYSNQADFDQGNYAASNDPTVSGYADGNTNTGGGGTPPQITKSSDIIPSKITTNIARGTNLFLNPSPVGKYAIDKNLREQYEKDKEIASDVISALNTGYGQAIGSQYFGPVNQPMRSAYAKATGLKGPTGPSNDGNDNVIIPPIFRSAQVPSDIESKPSDFDLYAALEGREAMNFGMNPNNMTGAMQRFSDGGEVRQRYGLGSFVKKIGRSVKRGVSKGIKGIKKFAKSDLGKAALLYATGTYLGGTAAFGGSGIGGKAGLKKFGFENFGKRLLSPTGADGFSNIFNPLRSGGDGFKLPFVQTEEQQAAELAKKINLIDNSKLSDAGKEKLKDSLITKNLGIGGSKTPALVKFGIPAAMAASYLFTKNEEPDNLDEEMMKNYKDTSGLKELYAQYPEYRFQVPEAYRLADGGRIGYDMGGDVGMMNLGGLEKDYREGGFVPIGVQEKADDVPARLSKNEFVFTADAVRAAGGGSVDKGADLMYKTMKNLESRVG